jgi:hypothetical protein
MHGAYRLIDKTDVAVTRPALENARWKCQTCGHDETLRVIDLKGVIRVVCDPCRVRLGSPKTWGLR